MDNQPKNTSTWANEDKVKTDITWDEANFTWDEADNQWDSVFAPLSKQTKNSASWINDTKH